MAMEEVFVYPFHLFILPSTLPLTRKSAAYLALAQSKKFDMFLGRPAKLDVHPDFAPVEAFPRAAAIAIFTIRSKGWRSSVCSVAAFQEQFEYTRFSI